MRVEIRIRFVRPQHQNSTLQILFFDVLYLFVHQQGLCKVFQFNLALTPDFSVNLQEDFEVPRHHIGEGVSIRLNLLELVVDLLNLLMLL